MKKLVVIAVLIFGISSLYAQDKTAADFRKEGKDAYRSKDYKTAFIAFQNAIEANEKEGTVDTSLFYNTGYCAYKSKKYSKASTYFMKSIDLGYKKEKSYIFAANSFKKGKDYEALDATLEKALSQYPESSKLLKIQANRLFIKGLGHYNKASELIQVAAQLVESDPKKFEKKKDAAKAEYKAALPFLEQAYKIKPTMKNLPEALVGVYEGLGMKDKAEKIKKEQAELQK